MNAHALLVDSATRPMAPLPLTLQEATSYVIQRARELVNELIKQRGQQEPPFLAKELAPLQGVKEIVKTDLKTDHGELDAILLRLADGYVIKVNAKHYPARQNFSCAHEIGHTFLHELNRPLSLDDDEFRMAKSNTVARAKERLCQIAAAELLMPEAVFKKYLSRFGVSITSIEWLAHTFEVSPPAAAIRVSEVSMEPCITLIWKRLQKTKSKGFMTKHKAKPVYVRDPSALLKAYETDSAVKSFKSFEVGTIRKRCSMESKGFGRGNTRYVISLVFPDR